MPCLPAISSHSLGRAWVHSLDSKLDQAALHRMDIELFYEDLLYLAQEFPGGATAENHRRAAQQIRDGCDARGVTVMCLQPFMHYDGLRDRTRHAERIAEMQLWIELAGLLGTGMIALPSTCLPASEVSGDLELIVDDMREVAELGRAAGVGFAYEALCWGTHIDRWEQVWEVVRRVDRPNFGMCFDTFNMAGRVYADPSAASGMTDDAEEALAASLARLVKTVDVRKIVYIQVVDAERLAAPLLEGHEFYRPDQCARMSWSRNCRLFYGEEDRGAYLPIKAILKALLVDLGFEGYLSAELFSRSLVEAGEHVPAEHAQRAADSWEKIVSDFGLSRPPPLALLSVPLPLLSVTAASDVDAAAPLHLPPPPIAQLTPVEGDALRAQL